MKKSKDAEKKQGGQKAKEGSVSEKKAEAQAKEKRGAEKKVENGNKEAPKKREQKRGDKA